MRKRLDVLLANARLAGTEGASPTTVALVDVDRFMHLIEKHGHAAGDRVLEELAGLLDATVGASGGAWDRVGKDAFAIVLPGTSVDTAADLVERIRQGAMDLDVPWKPLTVSIGVAHTTSRPDAARIFAAAHEALAVAKRSGRNRVQRADALPSFAVSGDQAASADDGHWPSATMLLSPEHQEGIRRVLELSGLKVRASTDPAELTDLGAEAGGPDVLVAAVADLPELEERLPAVARGELGGTAAVVFLTDSPDHDRLPGRPGTTFLSGEPSPEALLPLLSGLLSQARRSERERVAPVRDGFESPFSRPGAPPTAGRILIIDDEQTSRDVLRRTLTALGFKRIRTAASGEAALEAVAEEPPDLVILDLEMPGMDGFAVLEALAPLLTGDGFLPVLVVTGDQEREHRQRVLSSGAKDFLPKPFDVSELGARVLNLLETRRLHVQARNTNLQLESRVEERTHELGLAKDEIIFRLARAAEYRDDLTGRHAVRVASAAAVLATAMEIDPERCRLIQRAAPLHDVGKIGIPDAILLKHGRFTEEERAVMQEHTTIGADLLSHSTSDVIEQARIIALTHHERWDGAGYPGGLSGTDIPVEGRIVALVDALDALTHERPYKPAYPFDESVRRLIVEAGSAFDPDVVVALQTSVFRVRDIIMVEDEDVGPGATA